MISKLGKIFRNSSATRLLRNPPSLGEVRRLIGFQRPYARRMALAIVALFFNAGLALVFPWILQNLVNAVFAQQNMAELQRITILLLVTFVIRAGFAYIESYELTFVGESIVRDLRIAVYSHLQSLGLGFYAERRVGELISRLASDVTLVRTALTSSVANLLYQIINFSGSLALMLWLNPRLTLYILLIGPALSISAILFGRYLRRMSMAVQDRLADSNARADEALNAMRVVKAFGREPFEIERYGQQVSNVFDTSMQLAIRRVAFGPLISMLGFGALTAILWVGGREVLAGNLTGGELIAFLVYGMNVATSMGSFTGIYAQIQEASGAARRIFELLDEPNQVADRPGAAQLTGCQGQIRFEGVNFGYESDQTILEEIDLDIRSGETLALVGPSGAGKTTFFNLIPRFYDPSLGRILLDGQDLRDIHTHSLRAQIGLVPQDTQLFSDTIRENLRYGDLAASNAEIEAAARAANAEEFILKLPQGYETQVGERGVKLSGGQRQRIAIGRALLKNPPILLLDEATSSLDSESEMLVQDALEHLMAGVPGKPARTTIIIAHRLSTIQRADRIAVLDQGRLVELGNHQTLLANNQLYARLYQLQFERQESSEV